VNGPITVKLSVWDYDRLKKPDPLGNATFTVDWNNPSKHLDLPLSMKGTIQIEYNLYQAHLPADSEGNKYEVFQHSLVNLLREGYLKGGEGFLVYKVKMHKVSDHFGERKHEWNKNYSAAQKIFTSVVVANSIKAQHKALYSSIEATIKGELKNGDDLLRLIKFGVVGAKKRYFTYSLMDDHWNFCETGKEYTKDFTSKHAMHSGVAEHVRYAGEFHIFERGGKHSLVLDNNSGTYAPSHETLPFLKTLFQHNFPGLDIVVINQGTDDFKAYQKVVLENNAKIDKLLEESKQDEDQQTQ